MNILKFLLCFHRIKILHALVKNPNIIFQRANGTNKSESIFPKQGSFVANEKFLAKLEKIVVAIQLG